jgi:hypothetical protein
MNRAILATILLLILHVFACSTRPVFAVQDLTEEQLEQLQEAVVSIASPNGFSTGILMERKGRTGIFVTATAQHGIGWSGRLEVGSARDRPWF